MSKILICAFVLFFTSFTNTTEAATLHALLIGDSHDDELGEAIIEDLNRMHKAIKKISNITGLDKNEIRLMGNKATRQQVVETLELLKIASDDVVIVYFTMHGYRSKNKSSRWPDLFFGVDNAGVDLNYFSAIVEEKNPRLLIVLADCCNAYVSPGEISSTWRKKNISRSKSLRRKAIASNYQRLFLNTCGTIIASGSQPGEPSYGSDEEGSLFTLAFVEVLEEAVNDEDRASWQSIFDEIEEYIENESIDDEDMDEPQTPQYLLDICYC